jgi:iron complex transport system ATP-binding protein
MRLVAGLEWPNAGGELLRLGRQLQDLRALHRSIGWVSHALARRIPARELVLKLVASGRVAELGLRPPIATDARDEDLHEASVLMDQLGLAAFGHRRFVTLSQGEQQKVLLARALMAQPLLIILDEPCAGLDPAAREDFLTLLASVIATPSGPTLLFVTHHVEEILPGVNSTIVMKGGRIVAEGSTRSIITPDRIAATYGCPVPELIERNGRFWPVW